MLSRLDLHQGMHKGPGVTQVLQDRRDHDPCIGVSNEHCSG